MLYLLRKEVLSIMTKKTENQILLNVPSELLEKIEDYQFKKRISSRSEAIRELIKKGLEK